MLLHIQQFDGENVRGALEFLAGHAKRRRLLLAVPPLRGRRQSLQRRERTVAQNAEQVQVRQSGMKIARHCRAEQNDALDVRLRPLRGSASQTRQSYLQEPLHPRLLPTAACAAATGTAATKASEAATPAKSAAATKATSSSEAAASTENLGKRSQKRMLRSGVTRMINITTTIAMIPPSDMPPLGCGASPCRSSWLRVGELDSRIRRDDVRDAAGDQQQRLAVVVAAHQRDRFTLKASHLSVGQNRFESVAHFDAGAVILMAYRIRTP